jgi:hypothetical protein
VIPEELLAVTLTQLRLILRRGQIAGLDSEEGRTLNITCEGDAASLLVEIGKRERLVLVQNHSLTEQVAQIRDPLHICSGKSLSEVRKRDAQVSTTTLKHFLIEYATFACMSTPWCTPQS